MVQYIHVQTETSLRPTLLVAHLFENATHLVLNRFVSACFKEEFYNISFTVIWGPHERCLSILPHHTCGWREKTKNGRNEDQKYYKKIKIDFKKKIMIRQPEKSVGVVRNVHM